MKTNEMLIALAILACCLFAWVGGLAGQLIFTHEKLTEQTSYSRQLADEAINSANEFIQLCEEYEAD